eukprot:scaffold83_cov286-Prasinococcus_capsulatus_cf.AAC.1
MGAATAGGEEVLDRQGRLRAARQEAGRGASAKAGPGECSQRVATCQRLPVSRLSLPHTRARRHLL